MMKSIIELAKLKLVRMIIYVILLSFLGRFLADRIGAPQWRSSYYPDPMIIFAFEQSPESYDVLFIGSSRIQRGVLSNIVEQELEERYGEKVNVYNLAQEGANILTDYYTLLDALESKGKPRVVCIEMGPMRLNTNTWDKKASPQYYRPPVQMLLSIPSIRSSNDFYATLFSVFRGLSDFIILVYRNPLGQRYAAQLDRIAERGGGFDFSKRKDPTSSIAEMPEEKADIKKQREVERAQSRLLRNFKIEGRADLAVRQIIELCKENDIKLFFVGPPKTRRYMDVFARGEHTKSLEYTDKISAEHGLDFYDFYTEAYPFSDYDFFDFHHLNIQGSEKFSRILAREALPHYLTEDK